MICQNCGIEAPTKYVAFYQNIGALVVRFSRSIEGELCKSCIHRYFWSYTGVNCTLGWWGYISLVVTPFFILNNTFRYAMCLTMPPVPQDATAPELTDEAIDKIQPYANELIGRVNEGGKLKEVAEDIALLANVTPGQVVRFLQAVIAAQERRNS